MKRFIRIPVFFIFMSVWFILFTFGAVYGGGYIASVTNISWIEPIWPIFWVPTMMSLTILFIIITDL